MYRYRGHERLRRKTSKEAQSIILVPSLIVLAFLTIVQQSGEVRKCVCALIMLNSPRTRTYITMPTRSILTLLVHGVITNLKIWRETLNDIKM